MGPQFSSRGSWAERQLALHLFSQFAIGTDGPGVARFQSFAWLDGATPLGAINE